MHSAQELVSQIQALTSLPSVYTRIREVIDAPDGSLTEVSEVIGADPALAARLLKVVNSALYGYGGKIDSLHRAVTLLGLQQVHDMVLAMSLGSVFAGMHPSHMDMTRFWRDSVMRGIAAREIARLSDQPTAERMLVVGLLADIGHLVMYQTVPQLADEARTHAEASGRSLAESERDIVGCDFAEVGAALCAQWQLPACFAEIVGAQLNPRLAGEFALEASMVLIADRIVEAERNGETSEDAAQSISPAIWAAIGLQADSFGEMRAAVELNLTAYLQILFSGLRGS